MLPVDVDPEKLKSFAGDLKKFNDNIQQTFDKLNQQTNRLSESWQDQEFEKFKCSFLPTLKSLQDFTSETDKVIPKLRQDAEDIEEYRKKSI